MLCALKQGRRRLLGLASSQAEAAGVRIIGGTPSSGAAKPEPKPLSQLQDSFLQGNNAHYVDNLHEMYKEDPTSVDSTWASFFRALDAGVRPEAISEAYHLHRHGHKAHSSMLQTTPQSVHDALNLVMLIRAYQVAGHVVAKTDPLGLHKRPMPEILDPAFYGFDDGDLDREFTTGVEHATGFLGEASGAHTLRDILDGLRRTYCGSIGMEYMHIPDRDRCNWIRDRLESLHEFSYPKERRLHMLDRLAWSEHFESFLANKYTAAKRFGLEGAETLVPGLKAMIDLAAEHGAEHVVMGMPHRGRLNILGNVVRKPLAQIFQEFSGKDMTEGEDGFFGSGDVKYHLGTSYDRPTFYGKKIHLSLLANPSHLEAVNTVVLGKAKAKQFYSAGGDTKKVVPILLHGDGAFSGQGIVYETLDISTVPEYDVGGVIHVVVNNQVAFTTEPKHKRSKNPYTYCTDVARGLNAPIFHVNGDDVEAVVRVFEMAAEWRQTWGEDVVIDLMCYRRYGHNEIDEPMFTQPELYAKIKRHPNPFDIYRNKLVSEGIVREEEAKKISGTVLDILGKEFEASKSYVPKKKDWLASYWAGFKSPDQHARIKETGVPAQMVEEVGKRMTHIPDDFTPHRAVKKLYEARRAALTDQQGDVDWGTAEALAFGTLVREGFHVRLSGQDVERGTFSHRHVVIHDQQTGAKHCALDGVYDGQPAGQFSIMNSPLSEFGVLGYDLGYSLENPNSLVIWEAQFGDFANGAQIIFDQFLSSGEAKWLRQTGLVCLLPHGYDGQGPEHSSARLERFLQACDEDPYTLPDIEQAQWFRGGHLGAQTQQINWQVCNITTPANYFHALRRQVHREFRKPLIVMSPKALLRHPACKSKTYEFDDIPDDEHIIGVRFKRLIMDDKATSRAPHPPPMEGYKRLIFCSGKLYFELAEQRAKNGQEDEVAICRIEQLAPFPFDLVSREMRRYPNADIVWAQEEPLNMGAYMFVVPRINSCIRALDRHTTGRLKYAGRPPAAATSTGYVDVHRKEQAKLIDQALDLSHSHS
ncbi:unnamed protein product [Pedinophyceae sp. YPF-701]|nr:unnamed protein product [Pedinophyceae sp. YPF-701]